MLHKTLVNNSMYYNFASRRIICRTFATFVQRCLGFLGLIIISFSVRKIVIGNFLFFMAKEVSDVKAAIITQCICTT